MHCSAIRPVGNRGRAFIQGGSLAGFARPGAPDGRDTENVSDAERPPASVAVTLMLNDDALVGTVPVNASVAALKCSHVGKAAPFASVAV
jgi:hypothetical protein